MAAIEIRHLGVDDLDAALTLSSTAGWNQRVNDWRMLHQLAPDGSFAAVALDRIVGTAIGIDYGGFGWIAMMLVDPGFRGRGVGARLLEAAIGALPAGQDIRLDATPMGRPLYQRYGFEDEMRLTRLVLPARSTTPSPDPQPDRRRALRPVQPPDLGTISGCDRHVFGGHRRAVFEWQLRDAPSYAWTADEEGSPEYCFGRQGRLFHQIGPVVAADDEGAERLAGAALSMAAAERMVIDAFDGETSFVAWLTGRGFRAERPLFRMRLARHGAPARQERQLHEYAILGPEFG